jgi:hypothetical protein
MLYPMVQDAKNIIVKQTAQPLADEQALTNRKFISLTRAFFAKLFDVALVLVVLLVTLLTIVFFAIVTPLVMLLSVLIKKSPHNTGWKTADAG